MTVLNMTGPLTNDYHQVSGLPFNEIATRTWNIEVPSNVPYLQLLAQELRTNDIRELARSKTYEMMWYGATENAIELDMMIDRNAFVDSR